MKILLVNNISTNCDHDLVERRYSIKVMCGNYMEFYRKLVGA